MKKIIAILLFSFFIMNISSCTKDDTVMSNNTKEIDSGEFELTPLGFIENLKIDKINNNSKDQVKMRMVTCIWGWIWENGGLSYTIIDCHCVSISHNCLPTVTISSNVSAYNNFKTHYDNGTLTEYFATDDYKSIFSGLDDLDIVDELQNGEIILYLNNNVEMDKDLYIGLPQGIEFSTSDTSWMSKTECVLVIDDDL